MKTQDAERLRFTIERFAHTTNDFAIKIGLERSAGLYHILAGKYRISRSLAEKIVKRYPEVSIKWLLTGEGDWEVKQVPQGVTPGGKQCKEMLKDIRKRVDELNAMVIYYDDLCDKSPFEFVLSGVKQSTHSTRNILHREKCAIPSMA